MIGITRFGAYVPRSPRLGPRRYISGTIVTIDAGMSASGASF